MVNAYEAVDQTVEKLRGALRQQNMYKAFAWFVFAISLIVTVLISLATASWDFEKLLVAMFWIDFSLTFTLGLVAKYAFGRWGDFEGHKFEPIIKALQNIEQDHTKIKEQGLTQQYDEYVENSDKKRKLKALRNLAYKRLRFWEKWKKWRRVKEGIKLLDKLNKATDDDTREEIEKELEELNFSLDSYRVKYSKLDKGALETGYVATDAEDGSTAYSMMYTLFVKNILVTIISFIVTILLAIISVNKNDLTFTTIFVALRRGATIALNSNFGFSIAKDGVEKAKLNVLNTIHNFLTAFLEAYGNQGVI